MTYQSVQKKARDAGEQSGPGPKAPSVPSPQLSALQAKAQNSPVVQAMAQLAAKAQAQGAGPTQLQGKNPNGLPYQLQHGVESLSGVDMSQVRVHYNSPKPAQLQAHAYAQGRDIHLGPGQEGYLPHEAWHVVQQAKGRVRATAQLKGVGVNDDPALEREADVMGGRVVQQKPISWSGNVEISDLHSAFQEGKVKQLKGNKKYQQVTSTAYSNEESASILKSQYNQTSADSNVGNPGAGGGAGLENFIVQDVHGTRHHIYPKSSLSGPALTASRFVKALLSAHQKVKDTKRSSNFLFLLSQLISNISKIFGLNLDGTRNDDQIKDHYYWHPGNYFGGVSTSLRTDDPGNSPEPNKPRSIQQSRWDSAKKFGVEMKEFQNKIESFVSGKKDNGESYREIVTEALKSKPNMPAGTTNQNQRQ